MAKKKKQAANNRLSFNDMLKESQLKAQEEELLQLERDKDNAKNAEEQGELFSVVKKILNPDVADEHKQVKKGELYLIATPIGNLEDITLRALKVLQHVDVVAAEDTRQTRKLLSYFMIHNKRLESLHIHNERGKTAKLLERLRLENKSMAIVSDAGTPCIADPGFFTVREAVKLGIKVNIVPGVSAVTFAAVAAALPVDRFTFDGFVPVKSGRKTKFFEQIKEDDKTHIMFESPHRIAKTLIMIADVVGEDVSVAVIREATKVYEEILHGTAAELVEELQEKNWKGELVVVVSPQM